MSLYHIGLLNKLMIKLHFGCSATNPGPLDGWDNLDINPSNDKVKYCDVTQGLPYEDNSVSHILSVHTFEHFTLVDARKVMRECYRVLNNNGVIRIIIPDLKIALDEFMNWETSYFNTEFKLKTFKNKYEFLQWYLYDSTSLSTPHKFMYYDDSIIEELKDAGFKFAKVTSDDNTKSEIPEFNLIKNFPVYSLAIEATK